MAQSNENVAMPTERTSTRMQSSSSIEDNIIYSATDSIIILQNGMIHLHGNASITYQDIQLNAAYIRLNIDSSLVFATGIADTLGVLIGSPVFKEGSETYESSSKAKYS